jgi:hypothetical protein
MWLITKDRLVQTDRSVVIDDQAVSGFQSDPLLSVKLSPPDVSFRIAIF